MTHDEAGSYRVLRSRIDLAGLPPLSRAVTERVIHDTADFGWATDLMCEEPALEAGAAALAAGAPAVADAAMAAAGVDGYPVICKVRDSLAGRLSRTAGIPVTAAAMRLSFGEAGPGAVWLVSASPEALAEIISRGMQPALVIGVPAGLTGAAEAKDALRASGLPALTNASERGGAVVAAAVFNALLAAATRREDS
jgi:precorrin-8X/cobalt-precorrin-8 methylmutase